MPDTFPNSEWNTAVEHLMSERNGKEKTPTDVFDLVVAVNHDSITRDTTILKKYQVAMERHVVDCHSNDKELVFSYKVARWVVAGVATVIIVMTGNFLMNTYIMDRAESKAQANEIHLTASPTPSPEASSAL